MLKVSIVVIEKNEAQYIKKCLDSLLNQTYKNFEIIVVDGSSTDGTPEIILKEYNEYFMNGKIKLVVEPGLGFAHARNIGVKRSSGDIVVFTGGNELAHPLWLENLVKNFNSKDVGGVYGRMAIINGGSGLLKRFCKFKRVKEFSCIAPEKGVYGRGTNMAFRKHIIEEVGFFDEYLCDADDTELAWRVSKKYKILYEPSAVIFHQKGEWENWHSFLKYLWRPIQGHAQAARKNGVFRYYPRTTLLYVAPILYLSLLLFFFAIEGATLSLLALLPVILGLLVTVIKDAIKFNDVGAFYGLLIYPIQLLVGSVALLTGFVKHHHNYLSAHIRKSRNYDISVLNLRNIRGKMIKIFAFQFMKVKYTVMENSFL